MAIPLIKIRKIDPNSEDGDLISFESEYQHESRLQNQVQRDKIRAVKNVAQRITAKKKSVKKSRGTAKKLLQEQLDELYVEQFALLKNEILDACKDSAGLIDFSRLEKVHGSSKFIKELKAKTKNQRLTEKEQNNGTKHNTRNRNSNHKSQRKHRAEEGSD